MHLKLNWLLMKHLGEEDISFLHADVDIPRHLDLEERIWIRKVIHAAKQRRQRLDDQATGTQPRSAQLHSTSLLYDI